MVDGNRKNRARPDRDRRVRQADRIARVLQVYQLISGQGRWNAAEIAGELECSERTVFRDLKVLEFVGIPWYFDDEAGCYRVHHATRLPGLPATNTELFRHQIEQAVVQAGAFSFTLGVEVDATPRAGELGPIIQATTAVLNLQHEDSADLSERLSIVQNALIQQRQLESVYRSPYESEDAVLTLNPYRLCFLKRAWYVIGRDDQRPEPRTYRVSRFRNLETLTVQADDPTDFNLDQYLKDAWAVFCSGEPEDVVVRFHGPASHVVTETCWHHSQQVAQIDDDCVELQFRIAGFEEFLRWLLSWAPNVTVVGPEELKVRWFDVLEQTLQQNSEQH